jgi:hypothetical protein
MLASTCIAVLFVPAFFVVLQRFSERAARRQMPQADPNRAGAAEADDRGDAAPAAPSRPWS